MNWFRKDEDGKFLWPGFGENMRVLKWIVDRVQGRALRGRKPARLDAALRGYLLGRASSSRQSEFHKLMEVGRDAGAEEAQAHEQLFDRFYGRLPKNSSSNGSCSSRACGDRLRSGN